MSSPTSVRTKAAEDGPGRFEPPTLDEEGMKEDKARECETALVHAVWHLLRNNLLQQTRRPPSRWGVTARKKREMKTWSLCRSNRRQKVWRGASHLLYALQL